MMLLYVVMVDVDGGKSWAGKSRLINRCLGALERLEYL